jgi:hypothetical protein
MLGGLLRSPRPPRRSPGLLELLLRSVGNAAPPSPSPTDRNALPRAALGGGGSGGRPLPPAYWPPGSPGGPWYRRGAMPGRQGRMSGTPPQRSSSRRSHSSLTACPGPRLAGHGRWRGWDAPSARAASLASSAALPVQRRTAVVKAAHPYVIPYVNPYVIPYAQGVRTPGFAGRVHRCWSAPFGGPVSRKNRG